MRERSSRRVKVQRQRKALGLSPWGNFTYPQGIKVKRKISLKNAMYWNSLKRPAHYEESPKDIGFVRDGNRWTWP